MEEMILVNNLRKEFTYYKKGAGLQGSLNNLFHRQMLTKEAVKDVSFSVGKGEEKEEEGRGKEMNTTVSAFARARKGQAARGRGTYCSRCTWAWTRTAP